MVISTPLWYKPTLIWIWTLTRVLPEGDCYLYPCTALESHLFSWKLLQFCIAKRWKSRVTIFCRANRSKLRKTLSLQMLRLRPLELDKRGTLYRVTQENSIESSAQDSLPYIPRTHGPCWLLLTYPKQLCVYPKVNMCSTCCMTSSFRNLLHPSVHYVTCDCVMWQRDLCH